MTVSPSLSIPARSALSGLLLLSLAIEISAQTRGPRTLAVPSPATAVFVENVGQGPVGSRFMARRGGMNAHFGQHSICLQLLRRAGDRLQAEVVNLAFDDARTSSTLRGEDPRIARFHYFLGRGGRHTGARTYGRLRYRDLWEGIDIVVRDQRGTLEYDLLLAPGARLEDAVIRCEGAEDLRVEPDGRLTILTKAGPVQQTLPIAWHEDAGGNRTPVACRFRRIDRTRFGFAVPDPDPEQTLVIDPGLEWSTYLGGAGYDYVWRMTLDAKGQATLAGYTTSASFPTKVGSYDTTYNGSADAVVSKLAADGKTLLWSTFLGGGNEDRAYGLAVSASGEVTVTGFTKSKNFPVTAGAFQGQNNGGFGECFVARLDANGSALKYSTYLGGKGWDWPNAVVVDRAGTATVLGITQSTDFPLTNGAYDTTHNGGGDGFVARLNAGGTGLVFSTYLGSSGWDPLHDLTLDDKGDVFIVGDIFGVNNTSNFPTTAGAFDRTFNDKNAKSDTIVCKLSANGSKLLWSTWLGGDTWDPPYTIVLDENGNPTICGETWSPDFPVTANAYQKANAGLGDVYVARMSPDGSRLLFSTLLGGKAGEDKADNIAIDPFGALVISGWTDSRDFPTTPGAISRTYMSKNDAFVARLSPDASKLYYSTLFNGSGNDHAYTMALDARGAATIAGDTFGADFRTTAGALDTTYNGRGDAYVARLDVLPTSVSRFGAWAPACGSATPIGITVEPRENATGFGLLCAGAPPSTAGLLLLGVARFPVGLPIAGALVHVDLTRPSVILPAVSGARGRASFPVPLGSGLKGVRLYNQFVWLNTSACGGLGTLSSSNAIDMTVQ